MAEKLWLVTGGTGQVGHALGELSLTDGVRFIMPGRSELDLGNLADIASIFDRYEFSGVINCAAYTAVDQAESEAATARKVNGDAPAILAREAAARDIPIIHISTDYVFDGSQTQRPYMEDDAVAPQNVYGQTKLLGEHAVAASGAEHVILRTAWVVSDHGANFVKTMLRLGQQRNALSVVADQHGNPTGAKDIAMAVAAIVARYDAADPPSSGVYHFVNTGKASWYDLAQFVFARAEALTGRPAPNVSPITTAEYPTPASRPANSQLNTDRFVAEFGWTPRPWQEAVGDIVDSLCVKRESEEASA